MAPKAKLLPETIDSWLDAGDTKITERTKPKWLLSPFSAPVWKVFVFRQSRLVNDKWKGVLKFNWDLRLPGSRLTDPQWARLLKHCRLLFVAHLECPDATCHVTSPGLRVFHATLMMLAEHLVVHNAAGARALGLRCLTAATLERFAADFRLHGSAGTGKWFQRWEKLLHGEFIDSDEQLRVKDWRRTQSHSLLRDIDDIDRPIISYDGDEFPKLRVTLSSEELRFVRSWLVMHGWLDEYGCLRFIRFADAIEVSSPRLRSCPFVPYYLRQFELCKDYRRREFATNRFCEKLSHRHTPAAQRYYTGMSGNSMRNMRARLLSISRYAPYIEDLAGCPIESIEGDALPPELFNLPGARTHTIPVETALYLYDRMIHWALAYSKPLFQYYRRLLTAVCDIQGHPRRQNWLQSLTLVDPKRSTPTDAWEIAFQKIPPPKSLKDLRLLRCSSFCTKNNWQNRLDDGGSIIASRFRGDGLSVVDAMKINVSVLAGLIGAMTLRRKDEILKLLRDGLVERRGVAYVDFGIGKAQIDGVRADTVRPLPHFLFDALTEQRHFAIALVAAHPQEDELLQQRLFVVPHELGCTLLDAPALDHGLDLFCDYIEAPCDQRGRRWYLRIHECRRFVAMSFFQLHGSDTSLPALAWWMGHDDIKSTWHYVQEELTGREITQVDAAIAAKAIQKPEAYAGAARLKNVVLRYFHTDRLDLIDPDRLTEYLEMIREEGLYRIRFHGPQVEDGSRPVVLIEISEELNDA
jgi:hypothetical protein